MFTTTTFLENLKAAGITVTATDGRLVVTPASRLTDSHRATLKAHKADILKALANLPDDNADIAIEAWTFAHAAFPRTCEKCESFQLQAGHPHAGKCAAGHYPNETLWSTDIRFCRQIGVDFVRIGTGADIGAACGFYFR